MPARLTPADPSDVRTAMTRFDAGAATDDDVRLLVKHWLAVLARRAPGGAVEVRVRPYSAVQCIGGTRHKRGTPPAVVELDAPTWIGLATGGLGWRECVDSGRVRASGERSDLGALLPLVGPSAG